jgi:hypothetical protein
MTAAKTIAVRRGGGTRHYDATGSEHEALFRGVIRASHLSGISARWHGLKQVFSTANALKKRMIK